VVLGPGDRNSGWPAREQHTTRLATEQLDERRDLLGVLGVQRCRERSRDERKRARQLDRIRIGDQQRAGPEALAQQEVWVLKERPLRVAGLLLVSVMVVNVATIANDCRPPRPGSGFCRTGSRRLTLLLGVALADLLLTGRSGRVIRSWRPDPARTSVPVTLLLISGPVRLVCPLTLASYLPTPRS
jgi:hypothetical protein